MIRHEEAHESYEKARSAYLRALNRPCARLMRLLARLSAFLWSRCAGALVLLWVVTWFAIGLCASEGRWVMAEVTAYCPCDTCTDGDRITADGTHTDRVPYAFAADRSLAIGSRIYVPTGLGVLDRIRSDERWFRVDDRGGALDTEAKRYRVLRLDLRVREHWWATNFGRRTIPVFIAN